MPPAPWALPEQATDLYAGYLEWLAARGVSSRTYLSGARGFLVRFPDPQAWAGLSLEVRLRVGSQVSPFLNFLMFHGHLRPGYDFLLERRLYAVLRDAAVSPLGPDLGRFLAGAEQLGYSARARTGMASEVAARVLIQSGRPLGDIRADDLAAFEAAIGEREARNGRDYKHYRSALDASRAVIYHLGAPAEPAPKRSTLGRWSWERTSTGSTTGCGGPWSPTCSGARPPSPTPACRAPPVSSPTSGGSWPPTTPELATFAKLDRQRHIEPYLSAVAAARNHRTGETIAVSTQRSRIQAVGGCWRR